MRTTRLKLIFGMCLAILLAIAPSAFATTCPAGDTCMVLTTSNTTNPPIPAGPYGLVEMSQSGNSKTGFSVTVTIAMNPGFGVKLSGGDIMVNVTNGTTLGNFANVMAGQSLSSLSSIGIHNLKTGGVLGSFTFSYDQQLKTNQTQATYVTFTLNNVQISQLTGFGIHLCVVAKSGYGCALTGFAVTGPVIPSEPEPGTLGLFGTGLVGIAGLLRRKLRG